MPWSFQATPSLRKSPGTNGCVSKASPDLEGMLPLAGGEEQLNAAAKGQETIQGFVGGFQQLHVGTGATVGWWRKRMPAEPNRLVETIFQ